ncbi:S41 family peptidase [Sphingobacterium multivorum]|uniref:S41 family peptidase n=1 Tax=Sphingobacterium multivorum TaxID=28454 RepID=UPI003DA6747B
MSQPYNRTIKSSLYLALFLGFYSCKKKEDIPPLKNRNEEQLLKDSLYYYYNKYSYWSDDYIPDYSDISIFSDQYNSPREVLDALKSKTPYDRYSYFYDISTKSSNTAKLKADANSGYGILYWNWGIPDSKNKYPLLYMVERGSPAYVTGLRRSDLILEINGQSAEVPVSFNESTQSWDSDPSRNSAVYNLWLQALNGSNLVLKVAHEDGNIESVTINYQPSYEIDPLLKEQVYEFTDNNVGYLAYSSFEEIESNNLNQRQIDAAFNHFENKNIKSLIVDLRYNGGGYVDAAAYLADKIINSAGDGKLMFKYDLNKYLTTQKNNGNPDFQDIYYSKKNNLELTSVYFIVSKNTASAAELLINVLRAYLNVKLIAEQSATYGKPVGFFEKKILNKISFWPASFKLINSAGISDYWNGIAADKIGVNDYGFSDFGDPTESMIATALDYAAPNRTLKASEKTAKYKIKKTTIQTNENNIPERGMIKLLNK